MWGKILDTATKAEIDITKAAFTKEVHEHLKPQENW